MADPAVIARRFAIYCALTFGAIAGAGAIASGVMWTVQAVWLATGSFLLTVLSGAAWFVLPICAVLAVRAELERKSDASQG